MSMTDISIDLETLSTRFDAAILSIGAVEFNRHTGQIGRTFYAEVDVDSALASGHVSGDTLSWWVQQSESAKRLFSDRDDKVALHEALVALAEFVCGSRTLDTCVWGNGATFDITLLETAYHRELEAAAPWKFWTIRDMRTIVDVASANGFDKSSIPFEGTTHNALDDAAHQARVISAAWQASVRQPAFATE